MTGIMKCDVFSTIDGFLEYQFSTQKQQLAAADKLSGYYNAKNFSNHLRYLSPKILSLLIFDDNVAINSK